MDVHRRDGPAVTIPEHPMDAVATIVRTARDRRYPASDNARTVVVRAGAKGTGRELARLSLRGNLAQAQDVLDCPALRGVDVTWAY
jgi:hypothetical protein